MPVLNSKNLLILTAALLMLLTFWWLLNLAMPDAAIPFSIGITTVIMSGLLSGRYVSRLWFKPDLGSGASLIWELVLFFLAGCVSIGLLVNRMIDDTEFFHFLMTLILLFFVSACMGAVVRLIRQRIRLQLQDAQTAMIHSKSELLLLQSQLSPHFLFNTLNNMYGLSLANHPKVPELLLKLSELLRYSVYDTKELLVPLQHEIDYLINYIEFEKMRLDERLHLESNLEDSVDSSWQIAPMLLVVFVENAFKHAKNSWGGKVYVVITLEVKKEMLQFSVKNSRDSGAAPTSGKRAGFGLKNVKKRLELLYKEKHTLNIIEAKDSYEVNLILTR